MHGTPEVSKSNAVAWIGSWNVDGKRGSKVVGLIKDMTKSEAGDEVAGIVTEERAKGDTSRAWRFGEVVEKVYFRYYTGQNGKDSTRENNINRVNVHLKLLKDRELQSFRRDEFQDLLDLKSERSFIVLGRRSSALGSEADFRYGRRCGACGAQSGSAAVYSEGRKEAGSTGHDH